jgi:hypothetical protein
MVIKASQVPELFADNHTRFTHSPALKTGQLTTEKSGSERIEKSFSRINLRTTRHHVSLHRHTFLPDITAP